MRTITHRFTAWIFIVSAAALPGCGTTSEPEYRAVELRTMRDPLAPRQDFPVWSPPKQFAVWIHPHRDVDRQIMVGGHWMMILLSEGSWYIDDAVEGDPVPDAEASQRDVQEGVSALAAPHEATVPYRLSEE